MIAHTLWSHRYNANRVPIEFHTWITRDDPTYRSRKKNPSIRSPACSLVIHRVIQERNAHTSRIISSERNANSFTFQRERVTCRSRASRAFRIFQDRAFVVSPRLSRVQPRRSLTSLYRWLRYNRRTYSHTRDTHLPPSLELVSAEDNAWQRTARNLEAVTGLTDSRRRVKEPSRIAATHAQERDRKGERGVLYGGRGSQACLNLASPSSLLIVKRHAIITRPFS